MDEHQVDHFRRSLEDKLAAIEALQQARRESSGVVELDQTRTGRLSRMDALQLQAMAQAGSAHADREAVRIRAALRRIDAGHFGDCLECGDIIAEGRLKADPAATLCIDCANAREQG
jgi:DnaK suppressor protein